MVRIALSIIAAIVLSASATAMVGGVAPRGAQLARHVVAVLGSDGRVCTGTAVARNLVLTAAHCVPPGATYQVFELGDGRPRRTNVARSERHPQFDFNAAASAHATTDIALIKLAKPLSTRMVPATLGTRDFFPAGERYVVAGFGSVEGLNDGTFGRLLVAGLVAMRHQTDLQLRLVDPVTRGESAGRSACSGDSGAPVFQVTRLGLVLVGVVSWAANTSGTPGCGAVTGATTIALVRPWLAETAAKLGTPLGR
jgi:secreted trypsin-like serine protease